MRKKGILGVLGGLGPLASARFLSSVYRIGEYTSEQEMPRILLYSDPAFPDRTSSFLNGRKSTIIKRSDQALSSLIEQGADRLLICCYTMHYICQDLSEAIREKLIFLPDLALKNIIKLKKKALLLCSTGSRQLKIFEHASDWHIAKYFITFPTNSDQDKIHKIIYQLKINCDPIAALKRLNAIAVAYDVDAWIFGCTEFHLLSNFRNADSLNRKQIIKIDALLEVVKMLRSGELFLK